MLSFFYWDPSPEMLPFDLPFLGRPVLWYGFLFALGFFLGYFVLVQLIKRVLNEKKLIHVKAQEIAEKITLYVALGALIGARLGDVLFYQDWHQIVMDPVSIIEFWNGGLASHGGAVGILIALWFLQRNLNKKYSWLTWKVLFDLIVIPTALAASCIRIGNFINQEILGTPTAISWGVVFGHPADRSPSMPRHPVQLYEAVFYFIIFVILWRLWNARKLWHFPGLTAGLFLTFVFIFRFIVEFFKEEQSFWLAHSGLFLKMGQLLSFPLIFFGIFLIYSAAKNKFKSF